MDSKNLAIHKGDGLQPKWRYVRHCVLVFCGLKVHTRQIVQNVFRARLQ